eukprot:3478401-Alexandrium_andersonii.AAC.1
MPPEVAREDLPQSGLPLGPLAWKQGRARHHCPYDHCRPELRDSERTIPIALLLVDHPAHVGLGAPARRWAHVEQAHA